MEKIKSDNSEQSQNNTPLHASCAAFEGRGVLIMGPSGSGKSSLTLALLARGADLVADDRVTIFSERNCLFAQPVPSISGRIEARGIGIFRQYAPPCPAKIELVVQLGAPPKSRLPSARKITLMGHEIALICADVSQTMLADVVAMLLQGKISWDEGLIS